MAEWIEVSEGLRVTGDGAGWIPAQETAIVADVHLGYARAARRRGGYLPNVERAEAAAERVLAIAAKLGARRLVIAGDLRHSTRDVDAEEHAEVARFLALLHPLVVELVAGNHDRGARGTSRAAVVGAVDVVHEPPPATPARWTIAGHLHPAVTMRDETGAGARYRCALVGERMVVLPAFSEWSGGTEARRLVRALPGAQWQVLPMSGGEVYRL